MIKKIGYLKDHWIKVHTIKCQFENQKGNLKILNRKIEKKLNKVATEK